MDDKLNEIVPVSMELRRKTVMRIEKLVSITGVENKAQIIALCVQVAEDLISCLDRGAKIYVNQRNGDIEQFTVSGI